MVIHSGSPILNITLIKLFVPAQSFIIVTLRSAHCYFFCIETLTPSVYTRPGSDAEIDQASGTYGQILPSSWGLEWFLVG